MSLYGDLYVFTIKKLSLIMVLGMSVGMYAIDDPEIHWDWSQIDTSVATFKPDFVFGTAVAEHQVSGAVNCPNSNWAAVDYAKDNKGLPRIHSGERSGKACDFWHSYVTDIQLLKDLQVKAFRFSVEWSNIEPEKGVIDRAAIAHYHDLCDKLIAAGIKPVVTLHHFTHPLWFEDLGAFEQEENVKCFVDFAALMMQELGSKVSMWATFNEPGVYVFQGYVRGEWPPFKVGMNRASQVTKHMLMAHVAAYKAMKQVKADACVGMVHSVTQFDADNTSNPIDRNVSYYLNHTFHDAITEFFATGNFNYYVPVVASLQYKDTDAPKSLDFFGINYYAHVVVGMKGQVFRPGEVKTDMQYCIYPEGLYRCIKDISERITVPQHIPIYITENGIADAKDDRRALFIKQYMYAMHKAIEDGYDVRGYFYWSLMDNFEWTEGYTMKFGLYDVDLKTQKRTLRAGAQPFLDVVRQTYAQA